MPGKNSKRSTGNKILKQIVFASNNKNKLKEVRCILTKKGIQVLSLEQAGFSGEIKETGETLAENALIKTRTVRKKVKDKIIIADDTGLEVDYLAKAPGVYSARFAGPECNYMDNNKKLLKILKDVKKGARGAVFRTVVAVSFPDGTEKTVEGRVKGYICKALKGNNGFGYDPVFVVPHLKKTYAQLTSAEKNALSHRKKAVMKALKIIAGEKSGFEA